MIDPEEVKKMEAAQVVYLAGPFTANTIEGIQHNIQIAKSVALALWKMGYIVMCPHTNAGGTDWLDSDLPESRIMFGDIVLMLRCDMVVLLPGWENSKGTQKELVFAHGAGMPVLEAMGVPKIGAGLSPVDKLGASNGSIPALDENGLKSIVEGMADGQG